MQLDGQDVFDATEPLIFDITDEDVTRGERRRPEACPIALAAMRASGATRARVHLSRTFLELNPDIKIKNHPKVWIKYENPLSLRTKIISFDRSRECELGACKLDIPKWR